jgi:hypothetical protein
LRSASFKSQRVKLGLPPLDSGTELGLVKAQNPPALRSSKGENLSRRPFSSAKYLEPKIAMFKNVSGCGFLTFASHARLPMRRIAP